MRINLQTLGCRLNEAELETWARQFKAEGHQIVNRVEEADWVVLNSCAVTSDAVRKSRQSIRKINRLNPPAKLIVSGCYASLELDEVKKLLGVDLVVANTDKTRLVPLSLEALDHPRQSEPVLVMEEDALFAMGRQRAFVKVQEGCRYRCAFCIVTLARGEEKSRSIADVVSEINYLHGQGVQEAILTGVHLGGYGSDLGLGLEDLLRAVLTDTDIPRLRLGSLEPWELSEDFFRLFDNPRFMPHLHLPLQSGSDSVLRRMARRCKTADYASLVGQARQFCPDLNLTTDIIVGFPGESEAEFDASLEFVESIGFGHIHIFSYSMRSGTKAATMSDQISEPVKKLRVRRLSQLASKQKHASLLAHIGREFPVLWEEGKREDGQSRVCFQGYTPNYLRVETFVEAGMDLCRKIHLVRLKAVAEQGDRMLGELTRC